MPNMPTIVVFCHAPQILTGLPYSYAFDGTVFAECCVLPPLDPSTNAPKEGFPLGITSVLKRGEIDSLI